MSAYYNDNDPFNVAWLRELIKANLIAPGEVDERSIEEVKPDDLRGFTQCHFFAGVGVWSYALRLVGWPDDKPVWTGSCPCPPFSSVGVKKACPQCEGTNPVPHVGRTGFFVCCLCDYEWLADARHLWPELWRLISFRRPVAFFGEQVAGDDGKTWLTLVRASLEILGYAVGAKDLCSAGFGASDIRQRLFFVADTLRTGRTKGRTVTGSRSATSSGQLGSMEHAAIIRHSQRTGEACAQPERDSSRTPQQRLGETGELGQPESVGWIGREDHGDEGRRQCPLGQTSEIEQLAHAYGAESGNGELQRGRRLLQPSENPLAGFWRDAEWIYCQDEKWRPVEPKYVKVADGPARDLGCAGDTDSKTETEEINAAQKINRDGQGGLRDLQQDQLQAARPPQGSESREQRSGQLTDFVRLVPSSYALAQLHGDTITAEALLALLKACGAERLVQYTPDEAEAIWRSAPEEIQDRLWLEVTQGGFVRTCEFPLVSGAINRVGRLRGYGNAINAEVAKGFIEAYMSVLGN